MNRSHSPSENGRSLGALKRAINPIFALLAIVASILVIAAVASATNSGPPNGDQRKFRPGEVIVRFKSTASAQERSQARAQAHGKLKKTLPVSGMQLLKLTGGETVADAVKRLSADPSVKYAQPNWLSIPMSITNDPLVDGAWFLDNTGQNYGGLNYGSTVDADIDMPEAWATATGTGTSKIALIDTQGFDITHEDLAANIWTNTPEANGTTGVDDDGNGYVDDIHGYNFADNNGNPGPAWPGASHGTATAGLVGAVGNNNKGTTGVNQQTTLVPIRSGDTAALVSAIAYAAKVGAKTANLSTGQGGSDIAARDGMAAQPDLIIAASATNGGNNLDLTGGADSCTGHSLNVICVAATDSNDNLATYSAYGPTTVEVAAPGHLTLTTYPDNSYSYFGGTSASAPVAAGVIGLMRSIKPSATVREIRGALIDGSDPVPSLNGKVVANGRINAANSIALLTGAAGQTRATITSKSLLVTTAPGTANQISVTQSGSTYTVNDSVATTVAGPGCTVVNSHQLTCTSSNVNKVRAYGNDGNDTISVTGTTVAEIDGGPGDDSLTSGTAGATFVGGTGKDTFTGSTGVDTVDYSDHNLAVTADIDGVNDDGSASEQDNLTANIDNIIGGWASDNLTGSAGNNVLDGGPGANTLNGLNGNDTMSGSVGNDVFNGGGGTDTVTYANHAVSNITAAISGTSGSGASEWSESDTIATDVENLIGANGADTLTGSDSANVIDGLNGDDTIDGKLGGDTFNGGGGIDEVTYSSRTAAVTAAINGLSDDGQSAEGDNLGGDIEKIIGSQGATTFVGGPEPDYFIGLNAADSFTGNGGRDTVDYNYTHSSPVTVNQNGTNDDGVTNEHDNVATDIEVVIGTSANDSLTGGPNNETLFGLDGTDALNGAGGDDVLVGGNDVDTYVGGTGSNDIVSYQDISSSSSVTASLDGSPNDGIPGVLENVPNDVEGLIGGPGSDTLTGSNGANTLDGGPTGDDTLNGNGGADVLVGDLAGSGVYDSAGFLRCESAGSIYGSDTLNGGDGNDSLYGSTAADTLNGGNDDDTLYGAGTLLPTTSDGSQRCLFNGGVAGGSDNSGDTFNGGAGTDTVSYANNITAAFGQTGAFVTMDGVADDGFKLSNGASELDNVGTDVENATGSKFDDVLSGNNGTQLIVGGDGNDKVEVGGSTAAALADCGNGTDSASLDNNDTSTGCESPDVGVTATVSAGVLNLVDGPAHSNNIGLQVVGADYQIAVQDWGTNLTAYIAPGLGCRRGPNATILCAMAGVTSINMDGGDLDDALSIQGGGPSLATARLTGGSGNDNLFNFSAPVAYYDGGPGNDFGTGGPNIDVVDYSTRSTDLTVGLNGQPSGDLAAGEVDFWSQDMDNVLGGSGNDVINANALNNVIDGGAGADQLTGSTGADTITGGSGIDQMDGGFGADTMLSQDGGTADTVDCSFDIDSYSADIPQDTLIGCENQVTTPNTTITLSPPDPTNDNTPTWNFTSDQGGSTFQCSLVTAGASASFGACSGSGTHTAGTLADGNYDFAVRAVSAGGTDPTPATQVSLTIDATAPDTTLSLSPPDPTSDNTPTWNFTSNEGGSTFQCSLVTEGNSPSYGSCSGSGTHTAGTLADGNYDFAVRAVDSAGNTDGSPATQASLTIDTTSPSVSISAPANGSSTTNPSPTLTYSATDASSHTEQCQVDGGSFAACTATLGPLATGSHSVTVRSTDGAGNIGMATSNFTVTILNQSNANWTTTTNLTSEGTADWGHWGATSATSWDHKSNGGSQISNAAAEPVGTTVTRLTGITPASTWTDGTGANSTTTTQATAITDGGAIGRGFTLTAAGVNTEVRTLNLYAGVVNANAKLELWWSSSPGSVITDTTVTSSNTTAVNRVFTIKYRPANATDTLNIRWTQNTNPSGTTSKMRLYSATLSRVGATVATAPSSINLTSEGTQDWAHWGTSSASLTQAGKSGATDIQTPAIKEGTTGSVTQATASTTANPIQSLYSWTNGDSPASNAGTQTGLAYGGGSARGFSFTVPAASANKKTLKLYVSVTNTQGKLDLLWGSSTTPAFTDTSVQNLSGTTTAVYTINLQHNTAGTALKVRWLQNTTATSGRVTLQSATLVNG